MHIVVGTIVFEPCPKISSRGRPVVNEKSLETPPVQIETIQPAEIVIEGKHIENASAAGYGKLGVLHLLGFDVLAEFFLLGQ